MSSDIAFPAQLPDTIVLINENPLTTARMISDISSVKYPEGIRSSRAGLNRNSKEGKFRRLCPAPLDLTNVKNLNISAPKTALAAARIISDISSIQYPAGVNSPRPDLNENAKGGKFRYDLDFLLQFMPICKEKPAMLPPLDAIGLEPSDQSQHQMTRTQSGRRTGPGGAPASRQSSLGLGFGPGTFNKGSTSSFSMGQFSTVGASKLSSQERFEAAGPQPVTRTTSQGGLSGPLRDRIRSKRGEKRGENNKVSGENAGGQGHGLIDYQQQQQQNLEPVAPLQVTANRWDRKAIQTDADSLEMVDRKVKGLLNKLTMEKFDSISDQIISWVNKSEKEKDGRTLNQAIRSVLEQTRDEAIWLPIYARLCRKMMEYISPKFQDDGIKNHKGNPIAGGQLFRKYLLDQCQEHFEHGWVAKEATAAVATAASKALGDEVINAAHGKSEEVALYSDKYYAAQKAKRQGFGLIKFIGELFKLQVLTERIIHKCVSNLLGNVDNPEEEEIESLWKLLGTVGGILDAPKARAHLDVYFARMKELVKSPNVTPRMQHMLQDLLELRERKWVSRHAVAAPTTIAPFHENAANEKVAAENESYQHIINPDGWAVANTVSGPSRPPHQDVDFLNLRKNSLATFPSRKGGENNSQNADPGEVDIISEPAQRKLQPHSTVPVETDYTTCAENSYMTAAEARKKILTASREFFLVRDLHAAQVYFQLPPRYHHLLVEEFILKAILSKREDNAQMVSSLFNVAVSNGLCSTSSFKDGFTPVVDILDNLVSCVPEASHFLTSMMKGAKLGGGLAA